MRHALFLFLALLLAAPLQAGNPTSASADPLEQAFTSPPPAARPWVYWFWVNGSISREGITADLEAMHHVGIGGALIMHVNGFLPAGPVRFFSPQFRELFAFALAEADRLGIEVTMNTTDGWTGTGGPWITPEEAMMRVVWTTTNLDGPTSAPIRLPQPDANLGVYHEIAVLAFPAPPADPPAPRPSLTSNLPNLDLAPLTDADPATHATIRAEKKHWIQFHYPQPFTARAFRLAIVLDGPGWPIHTATLEASHDGRNFRPFCSFEIRQRSDIGSLTVSFDEITAKYFRLRLSPANPITFSQLSFQQEPRLNHWQMKAGFARRLGHGADQTLFATRKSALSDHATLQDPSWATPDNPWNIDPQNILNLTDQLGPQDQLDWQCPPGRWTVLRIGYAPTGELNGPASPEGTGLEPDALSPNGIDATFSRFFKLLLDDAGPLAGDTLRYCHIDSWETGEQNWTADFATQFQRRRGYDLTTFLPVIAGGRIVHSLDHSERFLWDFRRTIADLLAENYYGRMRTLAHNHGIRFQAEAAGRQQFLYDPINFQKNTDLPMGEFWVDENRPRPDCKAAASAAHLYQKTFVGAEAFTSKPVAGRWTQHPYSLKTLGDRAFCTGVNRFVFHRYAMQPWLDVAPGMTMGKWGLHFERTNTWWNQGHAWMQYLARSQSLLQQGQFAADVLFLTGQGAPNHIPLDGAGLIPALPQGYDFDGCNEHVLFDMISVKNGRLALDHGPTYRLLLLPQTSTMTPQLLDRLRSLLEAGAVVVGPKPLTAPGLTDFPYSDRRLAETADLLWGPGYPEQLDRTIGKGRLFAGLPFEEIFARLDLPPDFHYSCPQPATLRYIHRRNDDAHWYFVSNQAHQPVQAACAFRTTGRPELWNPETGQISYPALYRHSNGRTFLPLRLEPAGATFVVFRQSPGAPSFHTLKRNGHEILTTTLDNPANTTAQLPFAELTINESDQPTALVWQPGRYTLLDPQGRETHLAAETIPDPTPVPGPWNLQFQPGRGAPDSLLLDQLASWTELPQPGARYFSGTATYRNTLDLPDSAFAPDRRLYLDLGDVQVIAEVAINGRDLGILWKPPFRLDATEALRPGRNQLEIRVTNLWTNRLIGDEQFPPDASYRPAGGLIDWPQWLTQGKPRPEPRRLTFAAWKHYNKNSPLLPSGLLGPVTLQTALHLQTQ